MKKSQNNRIIILCIFFAGVLTSLFSLTSAAQDSSKTKSKKKMVVLKIEKDDNGKTTVIDTTFNINSPSGQKEFEEFLAKHKEELENIGDELENIDISVDMPDFPDSTAADSMVKQFRFFADGARSPHYRLHNKYDGYDYEFDVPCLPDVDHSPFQGYEDFEGDFRPGRDMKVLRYNHDSPTLSDLIGDIPMDRVKSYSIKDRKNGKRIIIDIEDGQLIHNQDKVIVIREPENPHHKKVSPERQMKVIIKTDDGKKSENPNEPPPPDGK